MNYLPNSWEITKLGAIADIRSGGTPPRKRLEYYVGELPWAKIADLTRAGKHISDTEEHVSLKAVKDGKTRVFEEGTILFAMYGSIGKVAITRAPVASNQAILGIKLKEGKGDTEFFYNYLLSKEQEYLSMGRGAAQANLNAQIVKDLPVPLPPYPEQKTIGYVLSSIDEALEASQAVLEQLKVFKTTLLNQLVCSGLPNQHEKFKPLARRSGSIPAPWNVVALSDVTSKVTDMDHKMPESVELGVPLISVKDFTTNGIDYTKAKQISEADYERLARKCRLELGDFLFSRYGTIGEVRRIDVEGPVIASYSIAMIKPDNSKILPAFLFCVLQSNLFQQQARLHTLQSAQPDLGIRDLQSFRVPLPSVEEQNEIIKIVQTLECRTELEGSKLSQLKIVKQGLMQQLLTGKLRVTV